MHNSTTIKTNDPILKMGERLKIKISPKKTNVQKARESAGFCGSISPGLGGTTTRRREELKRVKWKKWLVI